MEIKNRFSFTKSFLSEIQEKIGYKSTVSVSYGPSGYKMVVSFHENEDVEKNELVNVDFDESDFQENQMYEKSVVNQVVDYVENNIK